MEKSAVSYLRQSYLNKARFMILLASLLTCCLTISSLLYNSGVSSNNLFSFPPTITILLYGVLVVTFGVVLFSFLLSRINNLLWLSYLLTCVGLLVFNTLFEASTLSTGSVLLFCALFPNFIGNFTSRKGFFLSIAFGVCVSIALVFGTHYLGNILVAHVALPVEPYTEILIASCSPLLIFLQIYFFEDQIKLQQEITQKYLSVINKQIPKHIASRMINGETMFANQYENVAVFFADLADFTALTKRMPPEALVTMLHELFSDFDDACVNLKCEKIKTIGDGYLVAKGLQGETPINATLSLFQLAQAFYRIINRFNKKYSANIALRIGINTGPVIAGVLGHTRTIFDLWGRTVNFASRLESVAEHNTATLSEYSYALVASYIGTTQPKRVEVKGLGEVESYQVKLHGKSTTSTK